MQIFNTTGLGFGAFPSLARSPAHALTVVVKGTFKLEHGREACLAPVDERQFLSGDADHEDNRQLGPRYDSDFAPFKPRADVLVTGICHAPGERPVSRTQAAIAVGDLRKRIAVIGDRRWSGEGAERTATPPTPFRSMPLRYDRSFGGPQDAQNPIGRGRTALLPNVELPERMLAFPNQSLDPAGFGPRGRTWARTTQLGTYDDRWLATRWPGFPEDFDFGYFNAAPPDQQVEGYLRGDETLTFENMHPDHARFESWLPGIRVRSFIGDNRTASDARRSEASIRTHDDGCLVREVVLRLDTLWVDMDAALLCLVWRGIYPTATRDGREVLKALLVTERLADSPSPAAAYADPSFWRVDDNAITPKPQSETASEPGVDPSEVERAVQEEIAQTRHILEKAGAPKKMLDELASVRTRDEMNAVLMAGLVEDPAAAARVAAESRERVRDILIQAGHDPSILDEPEEEPEKQWTRERVIAHAAIKGSFVRARLAGLDLSGLDLNGVALAEADLRSTNLARTKLDGADLTRAQLARANLRAASLVEAIANQADFFEADLTGADLSRASLSGSGLRSARLTQSKLAEADLTGAVLDQADLEEASLDGAELPRANLTGANLRRARGIRCLVFKATLANADLREAAFDASDMSDCILDGAQFGGASLDNATLDRAAASNTSFTRASLKGSRAEAACFERADFSGVVADMSNWSEAVLRGAILREASLIRADLTAADLTGADMHRSVVKHARLTRAKLSASRLTAVNFFQSTFEGADLTSADCRGSNLYGCELLDATLREVRLERANVKATKLAPRAT
ncbi:MAG: DUF2169 domain-containing protein [Polyangiaceae bacterium]|nr:DUF2169 domain-containing protein [Polyangiaceae bacterium]